MISYSIFGIIVVALLAVNFAYIGTSPVPDATAKPDVNDDANYDQVIDQRQNGTENLRIHMNDLTLMVAPSDGILQLMSASASDFLNTNNDVSSSKPSATASYSSDCGSEMGAKCKHHITKK